MEPSATQLQLLTPSRLQMIALPVTFLASVRFLVPTKTACSYERYSKPFFWASGASAGNIEKLHDTPQEILEKQRPSQENQRVPTKEFSASGRTVAVSSYHRPHSHADAGTRGARQ